jgi:hypothetical protein
MSGASGNRVMIKVRNIADVATVSYVDFISYRDLWYSPDFLGQTLCGACQHGLRSSLDLVRKPLLYNLRPWTSSSHRTHAHNGSPRQTQSL